MSSWACRYFAKPFRAHELRETLYAVGDCIREGLDDALPAAATNGPPPSDDG